ncbi:sugar phosphate isomerase/epimerase family protein [Paenibacillus abyssi]|uniref:Sugar phosphate isomerase n=1 Tax=Paenibacillus abyssi TaxID=1340531 RepID=A0A917CFF0_9BACL|nr:sugar phosphate isomerase/epimerase [Paenibacillus abyssi]GGF86782.1 sugar phosphate isomerase [Paenibacillus abyssi]
MAKMGIALQLYTVRDDLQRDFAGTLREIAAMGYEGVEFAGYGDLSAEEMKALLQELNLKAVGSHISLQRLDEQLENEIAYLKTIGAKYGIVPYVFEEDRRDTAAWQSIIDRLDRYGEVFRQNGLQLGYHNHDFEFAMKINGSFVFDAMYEQVSADRLTVEMDLGWVQYSGQDPLAYIAKYKGRLPLLHLKDFRKTAPNEPIDTVELGQGDLDLPSIITAAEQADVEWIIVEQDRCANPPLQSVKTSRAWLKQNYN